MFIDKATRLGSIVLSVLVASVAPGSSTAAVRQTAENQAAPTTQAKPSAAVPSLPAIQPTGNAAPAATPETEPAVHSLNVTFTEGKITVDATNASLNAVLHEVADKAGIKVTGGVSDESVFGRYGPASPSVVLATLLDGTATNMLLVDNAKGASELVLTPRVGGPTPPHPQASLQSFLDDPDGRSASRYVPPTRPFQAPAPGRGPLAQPPNFGPPPQNGFQSGSNSSDDNRTPQQIYEQLQNVNQQKVPDQSPQ